MNHLGKFQSKVEDNNLLVLSGTLQKINLLTERQAFQLRHLANEMDEETHQQLKRAYLRNLELRQFVIDQYVEAKLEEFLRK